MTPELFLEFCQRLRGLRAAQKNLHYTFECYDMHLMTDRFAEGGSDGFNCNGFIDEIQECCAMFAGSSIDEVEIDTYPEDYSISLPEIESQEQSAGRIAELFRELITLCNESNAAFSVAEANLFGNLAQAASRAAAFYDRMKGTKDGNQESTPEGLAEGDATGGE